MQIPGPHHLIRAQRTIPSGDAGACSWLYTSRSIEIKDFSLFKSANRSAALTTPFASLKLYGSFSQLNGNGRAEEGRRGTGHRGRGSRCPSPRAEAKTGKPRTCYLTLGCHLCHHWPTVSAIVL